MTNIEYVFVAQFFTGLMLAVVFFVAWRTIEPKSHTLSWSLLFVVVTLQYILNALVDLVPFVGIARDIYWVVVNAMALMVQALALVGFRQRAGMRGWPRALITYLVVVEALVFWFTMVYFHQGLRMVLIPWSATIMLAGCTWILLRPGRKLRATEWGAVVMFLLKAVADFASGAAALAQGAQPDERYLELYRQINFLTGPAMVTGLGLFTVLILADDLADRMRTLAITDQLTGLLNRRGFEQAAASIFALARRQDQTICIALADLDHFKAVNDSHGHHVGDRTLRSVAKTLAAGVRAGDIVGRIGGEEFGVLLPWTDPPSGLEVIERLRRMLEANPLTTKSIRFFVTASFGVAQAAPDHDSIYDVLKDADHALYQAKQAGRNRVQVHTSN
ncbi:MAG: GGDEF domain-containing protein [bacterium]|nr:GGDEF domain-containing protein [bacterium]